MLLKNNLFNSYSVDSNDANKKINSSLSKSFTSKKDANSSPSVKTSPNQATSSSSSTNVSSTSTKQQFSSVNIKVKHIGSSRKTIDYSESYTANNFITTVRAFNEYLLRPEFVFI